MNKSHSENWRKKDRLFPYLMLLPTIIVLILFTFYPFIKSIYLSFFVTNNIGVPGAFVGFKNFARVFKSKDFMQSLVATMKYAAMVGFGTFFMAMFLSLISIKAGKGSKVYQTMYAIPMAIASVPIAALATYILSNYGILNHILGTKIEFLSRKEYALATVACVQIWSYIGASYIFLLVGFRNVSADLVEAATLDGASFIQRIIFVYIPMASPQIFFVIFLNIISSFKGFAIIKLLTQKGPGNSTNILVYAVYSNAFLRGRFETACVYSLVLCVIIFVFTRIQQFCEKRLVTYQ